MIIKVLVGIIIILITIVGFLLTSGTPVPKRNSYNPIPKIKKNNFKKN